MLDTQELTLKQAKFLDIYFQTGNATEAAVQAYDCKDRLSARNIGSENLAKLGITIADVLEEMDLSDKFLVGKLFDLLNAKKKITRNTSNGQLIEEECIDVTAVARGLDMAFKLKASYPPKSTVQDTDEINLNQSLLLAIRKADEVIKKHGKEQAVL